VIAITMNSLPKEEPGPVPTWSLLLANPVHRRLDHEFESTLCRADAHTAGIDLRSDAQVELLHQLEGYYSEQPFTARKSSSRRYHFENNAYSYSDAIFLYSMIRHLRPKRVIEVGSGYSSCVILDTNDIFFDGKIVITHIEPYPKLLRSLTSTSGSGQIDIRETPLQDVPLITFEDLDAGDILFIDSTHVSKTGSDVNYLFFEILPQLKSGVYVHLHDIFFPFEYPQHWILEEKRAWNEIYILRAFLQFNTAFEIVLMNTYLEHLQPAWFEKHMPLCLKNPGGSIWIRRA